MRAEFCHGSSIGKRARASESVLPHRGYLTRRIGGLAALRDGPAYVHSANLAMAVHPLQPKGRFRQTRHSDFTTGQLPPPLTAMPSSRLTPQELQQLSYEDFMQRFGGVYEHSPWVAERTWPAHPFSNRSALALAMATTLAAADHAEQLALIRAHPELTGKAAVHASLTAESAREQRGAGLDACTPAEFEELHALNQSYRLRFGFPFVVAVTGLGRAEILAQLATRVTSQPEEEFTTALAQINRIAGFRLQALIAD